jgi:DNA-binding transcriptional MerR regulator
MRQELLSTVQVADRLGVAESTVRYWRMAGEGPEYQKVGAYHVYCATDVDAWAHEQGRTNGHSGPSGPPE